MTDKQRENAGEVPLSWFGKTLWKFTPLYVELVFLAVCLRLIGLVEPFVFQVLIDRILPFQREASLIVVMVVFAALSLFQVGFQVLSTLLGVLTANKVVREFGRRIFEHLFHLPLRHFRRWPVGETIARVSETDTIRNFIVGTTTGVFLDLLFVVIYLAILFALSSQLALIVLASLPLQVIIYFLFGPFLRRRLRGQFDAGAQHQSQMVENISGIAAVKALSAETKMLDRLDDTLNRSLLASYRVATLGLASSQLTFIIQRAVTLLVIFMGAKLVFAGEMTLGQLIAFYLIAEKIAAPISNFSSLWESWQDIRVSRQRLGDIVNSETEPFTQRPLLPQDAEPRLTFQSVSFAYHPDQPVLTDFNFNAEPHSLTLVIGPSGIGKSTFGRLASGIEEPDSGSVLLGDHQISGFEPHDVRAKIAYVPQEPYLFTGTLRENLLLGLDVSPTDEALSTAMRLAVADRMVAQMPLGLDTIVGERGSALSGGQRQRIAIARSILMQPKVLVLDEPTSALDENAQNQFARSLIELKASTTVIVITHRPDVFESVDQVVDLGQEVIYAG